MNCGLLIKGEENFLQQNYVSEIVWLYNFCWRNSLFDFEYQKWYKIMLVCSKRLSQANITAMWERLSYRCKILFISLWQHSDEILCYAGHNTKKKQGSYYTFNQNLSNFLKECQKNANERGIPSDRWENNAIGLRSPVTSIKTLSVYL